MQDKIQTYGLCASVQQKPLSEFHDRGYGYANYDSMDVYGISIVSHDRMVEFASGIGGWIECVFVERGWGNHQDVYGFSKAESGTRSR